MAKGKISEFVPENVSCAENRSESPDLKQFGQVMSEPYRVAILNLLLTRGEVITREINREVGLSGTNIYYHLSVMQKAGMLIQHTRGNTHCWRINSSYFRKICDSLEKYVSDDKSL